MAKLVPCAQLHNFIAWCDLLEDMHQGSQMLPTHTTSSLPHIPGSPETEGKRKMCMPLTLKLPHFFTAITVNKGSG